MSQLSDRDAESTDRERQFLLEELRLIVQKFEKGLPCSGASPRGSAMAVQGESRSAHSPSNGSVFDFSTAATIIQFRKNRNRMFGEELFGEPTWDMLLDLFVARLENRRVCVTSLALAAAVPPTTGLRYIELMTRNGMIQRVDDPADGRRKMVGLAPATYLKMANLLGSQNK